MGVFRTTYLLRNGLNSVHMSLTKLRCSFKCSGCVFVQLGIFLLCYEVLRTVGVGLLVHTLDKVDHGDGVSRHPMVWPAKIVEQSYVLHELEHLVHPSNTNTSTYKPYQFTPFNTCIEYIIYLHHFCLQYILV